MSSDGFRRVGRGGAGNWYSKKDVEEAEKGQQKDLEAQKSKSPSKDPAVPQAGTAYSRAGRGGAGNFYEPETIAESIEKEDEAAKATAAVAASNAKPKVGLTGRGGAGNWTDNAATDIEQNEQRKKEAIEAKILEDVEAALKMPGRTYHLHDREME